MYFAAFNHFKKITEKDFEQGFFLWITHVDKIPPHIGISLNGNYFSIRVNGKDDLESKIVLKSILQKKIPSIFFKLKESEELKKHFFQVKGTYESINTELQTCLTPLLEMFNLKNDNFLVHDFIDFLQRENLIIENFALNLPSNYQGIKMYSKNEVNAHLKSLKNAKRSKHIS